MTNPRFDNALFVLAEILATHDGKAGTFIAERDEAVRSPAAALSGCFEGYLEDAREILEDLAAHSYLVLSKRDVMGEVS